MSRFPQPVGRKGSLKWIQAAVNDKWASLNGPILARLPNATRIEWCSPLASDDHAEYRDGAFLDRIGLSDLKPSLERFWPSRGPQWDALGKTDRADILLVEAKAHVPELCSPPTAAGSASLARISLALNDCATHFGAKEDRVAWTHHFYQLANRFAHLHFLRSHGIPAYLVLVNFVNDHKMSGPTSEEAWRAAYDVAFYVMGLGKRHPYSRCIIEVFPDVLRCN